MSKMMYVKYAVTLLCVAVLVIAAPGCKKKQAEPDMGFQDVGVGTGGAETTTGTGQPDLSADALRQLQIEKLQNLQKVYFDYDSYALRPDALEALKYNAEQMKIAPLDSALIMIEGHCDERGTQEYNLALGDRRALSVRDYLIKLGISGDRLMTVSYGEEVPAVPGTGEAAWSKNRRCEFSMGKK